VAGVDDGVAGISFGAGQDERAGADLDEITGAADTAVMVKVTPALAPMDRTGVQYDIALDSHRVGECDHGAGDIAARVPGAVEYDGVGGENAVADIELKRRRRD